MPEVLWVSLPSNWTLEEVQAGLQVMIALLSTWGIFAFSRFCWQLSSNLIKKNRAVALASLMSINTIGEAFDVAALLKRRLFRQRYWKLLAQSIVVVTLTVSTIVSGPIAKASTRYGSIVKPVVVPGYLATRDFNSRVYANVDWNLTYNALQQADFPQNQLLDFLPTTNLTWLYRNNEWNNSWTMNCTKTPITPITLVDSGICGNLSVEMPITNSFFAYDDYDYWYTNWNALYGNSTYLQDGMIILAGWNWGIDLQAVKVFNMTIRIAAVHMHGMPRKRSNDTSKCDFAKGQAEVAQFSKMECFLKRPRSVPDEKQIAFPDCIDYFALPQAFTSNYYDRMVKEVNTNQPVSLLSPEELIRFYQTYIATKDIQYRRQVSRTITANVRVVQLSSTFIAFGGLFALLVVIGLVNFTIFAWRNTDMIRNTPESKLDWIVQSILDESEVKRPTFSRPNNGRKSVIAPAVSSNLFTQASEKVRAAFETARYGSAPTAEDETPLESNANNANTTPQDGNMFNQAVSPVYGVSSTVPPHFANQYTTYHGYHAEPTDQYNMNPYEASYATQPTDFTYGNGQQQHNLQNPQSLFTTDRWRGYQRLG